MELRIEREWSSFLCPSCQERVSVMSEWEISSEKGKILGRTLRKLDCHNPELAFFGGTECGWRCLQAVRKRER